MDDISREPLPGGRRSGQPGMRGPVELVRLEALSVDETPLDDPNPDDRLESGLDQAAAESESEAFADSSGGHPGESVEEDFDPVRDDAGIVEELATRAERRGFDPDHSDSEDATAADPETLGRAGADSDDPDGDPGEEPSGAKLDETGPEDVDLDDEDLDVPELQDPLELGRVLMGVLLVSREAVTRMRLAEVTNSTGKAVDAALESLEQQLRDAGMPLEVVRAGDRIRLMTASALHPYVRRLKRQKRIERLSPAALETLAVVAYKQPVIRAEIEAIRGVKVGPMLKSLLDHRLCKVVGRADVPGRPLQYGTTELFLERFGLQSLKELPSLDEFRASS